MDLGFKRIAGTSRVGDGTLCRFDEFALLRSIFSKLFPARAHHIKQFVAFGFHQRQMSFFELLTQTRQLADAAVGLFKSKDFSGFGYGVLRAFAAAQIKAILLSNTKHLHRIVKQTLLAAEELIYRFDVFCVIEQIVLRFTNRFQQGGRLRALRKYGVNS